MAARRKRLTRPELGNEEKRARELAMAEMFTTCGVDASDARIAGYCNATILIPWRYYQSSLLQAIVDKEGNYQTAPQPNMIIAAAVKVCDPEDWDDKDGHHRPPEWSRASRLMMELVFEGKAVAFHGAQIGKRLDRGEDFGEVCERLGGKEG